jgi:ATP-dependent helicase HepA
VADRRWHVDQFLAPTPIRVVVGLRGNDLTARWGAATLAAEVADAPAGDSRGRTELNAEGLRILIERATACAAVRSHALKTAAQAKADAALSAEWQRLVDLRKVNDHVRPEEIEFAREHVIRIHSAIEQARLRLDALRLIEQKGRSIR